MDGDKAVRGTGYLAVAAVSGVAAWLSYWHAVAVVGEHGEPGMSGHLYPATIDGLIVAASMVLLDAARNKRKPPKLAWWLVGAGIVATLAANVLNGISFGVLGSIIAAWPAAAFVGAYEMIMVLIRSHAEREEPGEPEETDTVPPMPKLEKLIAEKPPWEEPRLPDTYVNDTNWFPEPRPAAGIARTLDTQLAEPAPPRDPAQDTVTDMPAVSGQVTVRNPLTRLDRKVAVDERLGRTGSFPAIPD